MNMKLDIPNNSIINDTAVEILRKQITYLIPEYASKYQKEYQIFLYGNHVKVIYAKKMYLITIIIIDKEIYWYLKPWKESYILIKTKRNINFKDILDFLTKINS